MKAPLRSWVSLAEALGVFVLIMIYIWWLRLWHPWLWVVLLGFIIGTHFTHYETLRWLGFSWDSFKTAIRPVGAWVLGLLAAVLAIGGALRTLHDTSLMQAAGGIAAYIAWGLFQQYLLNGYFANRLLEFSRNPKGRFVPLAAALLFSAAHLPNWFLMAVTFAGGYFSARMYLRYRNLYVLGLAHGVLGFALVLVVPDSVSGHFLVGPRYLLEHYGTYPEQLL